MLGLGTDKLHAVFGENLRETRVLRQESVAGMHGISAGDFAGRQDGGNIEVAVLCSGRPDTHALVSKAHMHCVGVGGGMHRDGRNAEFFAGAQHPQGDFAAVGDEDFIEHRRPHS